MATGGDTLSGGEEFAKLLSDFLDFSKILFGSENGALQG